MPKDSMPQDSMLPDSMLQDAIPQDAVPNDCPSPESLVILLHGVGANGLDLKPLGDRLARSLPGTVFAAPDAPFFADNGVDHEWFSLNGVTEANRPARVEAARAAFDHVLTAITDRHGLTGRLDRVALIGFSQGCTMALDGLLSGRWPVRAIAGLSGRLAVPRVLRPAADTQVLLVHGAADPIVPPDNTLRAAELLRARGIPVETHILPGVAHMIAPQTITLTRAFLTRILLGDACPATPSSGTPGQIDG